MKWNALACAFAVVFLTLPALAHDWYTGLMNAEGTDCCGLKDCRPALPTELRLGADGFEYYSFGEWTLVPETHVLRDRAGDGRPHVCPFPGAPGLRCLILPSVT